MDTHILVSVAIASALFVAVLVWKAVWLVRKIGEEPEGTDSAEETQDEPEARSDSG